MPRTPQVTASTVAQIVVLGAIWGGAFTLIKVLVHDLSPSEMASARLALGALAVVSVQLLSGRLRWPARDLLLPIAAVAMLDTVVPYTLVGWAESRIESGAASVLISAMPLFTVVFAAATMREERASAGRLAGIALGFAGVLTLVGDPAALTDSGATGELAVIGAAAAYAAGTLYARTLLRRLDPVDFTATKLVLGAALAWVVTFAARGGSGYGALDGGGIAALLTLGVLCTGVSFVLYYRIVARAGGVAASTVTYVIPVFGLLFGALFLDESIDAATLAGMALIATGVAGVMYAPQLEQVAARIFRRRASPLSQVR